MEATTTKPKNFVPRLLQFKREMRECIQNGADHEEMKRIADKYGFTFATSVLPNLQFGSREYEHLQCWNEIKPA